METYIIFNNEKRTECSKNKDKFGVDQRKLMNNSLFGKQINPVQDGIFQGCSQKGAWGWGWWAKRPLLPKICHTYPIMMKLVTAISYSYRGISGRGPFCHPPPLSPPLPS